MNRYEAMVILPESLKDAAQEETTASIKEEIKKLGGDVESVTRLGKRAFARKMDKQDAGYYLIVTFKLAGAELKNLLARFKLNEKIFRIQVVSATEPVAQSVPTEEAKAHGIA